MLSANHVAFCRGGTSASLVALLLIVLLIPLLFRRPNAYLELSEEQKNLTLAKKTKQEVEWWTYSDCFRPLPNPILGEKKNDDDSLATKIINVGFPKTGTTTLHQFLESSPILNSSHWRCGTLFCANCIQSSISRGLPPLATCGNFAAYIQMDFIDFFNTKNMSSCIFPQISYLKEIYEEAPTAIFILPFRNVTDWMRSTTRWRDMRRRMAEFCEFPEYNFTRGMANQDHEMENLYCRHVRRIRRFVAEHPRLTLLEYSINDDGVGDYLSSMIPQFHLNGSKYGHENRNSEKIPGNGMKAIR